MAMFAKTTLFAAVMLGLSAGAPAVAQDYGYGPHERYADDLDRPYEFDSLALGREAPFLNSDDVGAFVGGRGPSFEIEGPPIGSSLLPPR